MPSRGVDGSMNSIPTFPAPRAGALLVLVTVGALSFAGCSHRPIIVQTPAPTVIQSQAPAPAPAMTPPPLVVVNQAPPAPLQETQSPQPSQQHVWINGYWAWRANQQQWIPGHWEMPPRPGATWVPARWEPRGSEYVFVDGYWQ